jgi:hypothetical protein
MAKKSKIKVRRPGLLGGAGYTSKPTAERRKILRRCIETEGVVACQRALLALQSWSSSGTWAPKKRKAVLSDLDWIAQQLPNEPGARAAERLRRSLSKGKTMTKALKSAKARVGRISDTDKLAGSALYFSGGVHRDYELTDAQCRGALEVAHAALEKLAPPRKAKKKATKKKPRKNANVTSLMGESLTTYPRLPARYLSQFGWDEPLATGYHDDLVYEGEAGVLFGDGSKEPVRVWRSRLTKEDGMPCDDLVTLEAYRGPDGIWEKIDEYCPYTGQESNPGVVEPRPTPRASLKARLTR